MKKLSITLLLLLTISGALFAELPTDKSSYLQHPEVKANRGTELFVLGGLSAPRLGSIPYGGIGVNIQLGSKWYIPVQFIFGIDNITSLIGLEYEFLNIPFGSEEQTRKKAFYLRTGIDGAGGFINQDLFFAGYGTFTLGVSFPVGNTGDWFVHLKPELGVGYGSIGKQYYNDYGYYTYNYGMGFSSLITLATGYRF